MTRSPRELAQQKIQQRKQQEKLFTDLLTVVDALDRATDHWQKAHNNVNPNTTIPALDHEQGEPSNANPSLASGAEHISAPGKSRETLDPELSGTSNPESESATSHNAASSSSTRSPVAKMSQWKTLSWLRKWQIWWQDRAAATPEASPSPFASFRKPQHPLLPPRPQQSHPQQSHPQQYASTEQREQAQTGSSADPNPKSELREMIASALDGTQLIHTSMLEILAKHQVEPILAYHQPFDPESMKALGQKPDSRVPPNTVVQEIVRGYRWKDRVLREAQVIVAVSPLTT
ncbi:MAG: nucleotide exchange factor GrpE, partial [Symploca sp. SIO2B6]|nr:nucleotide exchange factor GrpE [Symploca sp. SIO2B6]